jgi:flavodoxin
MKALVVYHSLYGNTKQVAEAIAEVFQEADAARAISADGLTVKELEGMDVVVMGTPTHKMNLPEALRPVLEGLSKQALAGVPIAAFDTSYEMSAFLARFTAAKRIDRKLRKLGGKRLVPPETFHVHRHHEGPLFDGEIERAEDWAESMLVRLDGRRR